jgi:hypothetical protein
MLIYVAGPYSAKTADERLANVERACEAGRQLIEFGHWPLIPHLNHFFDVWHERNMGHPLEPETYMQWDFAMLRRCDGLLYLAPSTGADRELKIAREERLTIWTDVTDVPIESYRHMCLDCG